MLDKILALESKLIRVETWLLVVCVIAMLLMASYNVAYRNILVPWQTKLLTSGPPVAESTEEAPAAGEDDADDEIEGDSGFEGGFGVSDGDDEQEEGGGFEGGFGVSDGDEEQEDGGGFEGGFGGGFDTADEDGADDDGFEGGFGEGSDGEGGFEGGFGGGFEGDDSAEGLEGAEAEPVLAEDTEIADALPEGGPPPEGSFADKLIDLIDAMKIAWIDILLRQLVIISGFLGAMLATRRRNHITIDAVGKLIRGRTKHIVDVVTSTVSVGVCVVLALAGWDLVEIGLAFPSELLPWAEEWVFQAVFPIGFGLLALHFGVRVVESATFARRGQPDASGEGGLAAESQQEGAA